MSFSSLGFLMPSPILLFLAVKVSVAITNFKTSEFYVILLDVKAPLNLTFQTTLIRLNKKSIACKLWPSAVYLVSESILHKEAFTLVQSSF